jgi:hypothetical protein
MKTENSRNEVPRDRLGGHSHCTPGRRVIGIVISTHERMAFALAANLEFQRSLGSGGHVTTKILTLSRRLHEGETVRSEDVWQNP